MLVAKVSLFLSAFTDGKQEVPNWEEVLVSGETPFFFLPTFFHISILCIYDTLVVTIIFNRWLWIYNGIDLYKDWSDEKPEFNSSQLDVCFDMVHLLYLGPVLFADVRRPRSPFGDVQFGKGSSACMSLMCKCSFKTLALQNSCFLDVWINVLIKMWTKP